MDEEPLSEMRRRFRPVEYIAAGGFGVVIRAVQVELNREVVVKVLQATSLNEPNHVARFLAEAKNTARLRHPNIVQVIDHGADGSVPWIVYELLPGPTVLELL